MTPPCHKDENSKDASPSAPAKSAHKPTLFTSIETSLRKRDPCPTVPLSPQNWKRKRKGRNRTQKGKP